MARDCRIKEIPSSRDKLSWAGVREVMTNGVKENVWVQCRLDRGFGNAEWFRLFPRSHTLYLERLGSDHRPILTSTIGTGTKHMGRFMYDKRWSKSLKCWSSYVKVGTLFGVITEDQYQNVLTHAEKSSPNGSVTKSVALSK